MRVCITLLLTSVILLLSEGSVAGPERFPTKDFIPNAAGEKCSYQQKVTYNSLHFLGDSIANTVGEIVFDDPQCMKDPGEGLAANEELINARIASWYSHPDADFDTKRLRKSSLYQVVGKCMQSKNYIAIGIAMDYEVKDQSITRVFHGPTLEGCLD